MMIFPLIASLILVNVPMTTEETIECDEKCKPFFYHAAKHDATVCTCVPCNNLCGNTLATLTLTKDCVTVCPDYVQYIYDNPQWIADVTTTTVPLHETPSPVHKPDPDTTTYLYSTVKKVGMTETLPPLDITEKEINEVNEDNYPINWILLTIVLVVVILVMFVLLLLPKKQKALRKIICCSKKHNGDTSDAELAERETGSKDVSPGETRIPESSAKSSTTDVSGYLTGEDPEHVGRDIAARADIEDETTSLLSQHGSVALSESGASFSSTVPNILKATGKATRFPSDKMYKLPQVKAEQINMADKFANKHGECRVHMYGLKPSDDQTVPKTASSTLYYGVLDDVTPDDSVSQVGRSGFTTFVKQRVVAQVTGHLTRDGCPLKRAQFDNGQRNQLTADAEDVTQRSSTVTNQQLNSRIFGDLRIRGQPIEKRSSAGGASSITSTRQLSVSNLSDLPPHGSEPQLSEAGGASSVSNLGARMPPSELIAYEGGTRGVLSNVSSLPARSYDPNVSHPKDEAANEKGALVLDETESVNNRPHPHDDRAQSNQIAELDAQGRLESLVEVTSHGSTTSSQPINSRNSTWQRPLREEPRESRSNDSHQSDNYYKSIEEQRATLSASDHANNPSLKEKTSSEESSISSVTASTTTAAQASQLPIELSEPICREQHSALVGGHDDFDVTNLNQVRYRSSEGPESTDYNTMNSENQPIQEDKNPNNARMEEGVHLGRAKIPTVRSPASPGVHNIIA